MKAKIIYFASIALALLGGCDYVEHTSDRPSVGKENDPLPIEYRDYKFLHEVKEFGGYTIAKLNNFDRAWGQSISATTNNMIIEYKTPVRRADGDTGSKHLFLKLDTSGNIIDRYEFTEIWTPEEYVGDQQIVDGAFLVNETEGYYNTWPLNGDKTPKPFTPINKDLAWSAEQVDTFSKEIINKNNRMYDSSICASTCGREDKRRRSKIFYLKSTDKWYVLYGNSFKYESDKTLPYQPSVFDRAEDKISPSHIATSNSNEEMYWKCLNTGAAANECDARHGKQRREYYNLALGDSVLRFKINDPLIDIQLSAEDLYTGVALRGFFHYTNPNLKYSLLSDDDTLYLFKRK